MTDNNSYKFLPFNFMRLNTGVLVVNIGGDYLLLSNNDFERFVNKPKAIANIYSFLGASPDFVPNNIHKKVNISVQQDEIIDQTEKHEEEQASRRQ